MLRILFTAQETPENVKSQFKLFEHEKGAITFQSLRKACHAMGEHLTDDQIQHMLCYQKAYCHTICSTWYGPYDGTWSQIYFLSNYYIDRRCLHEWWWTSRSRRIQPYSNQRFLQKINFRKFRNKLYFIVKLLQKIKNLINIANSDLPYYSYQVWMVQFADPTICNPKDW